LQASRPIQVAQINDDNPAVIIVMTSIVSGWKRSAVVGFETFLLDKIIAG
jgi:hypothetical protein